MRSFKFLLSWISGVLIAMLIISWFRNEGIDWVHAGGMILGGIIGVLIAAGIRGAVRKEV
ncbi:hypothetical protein ACDX78_22920 [Virgibacillus oceani]